jgi:SAM-dependent methyltransferase
MLHAAIDNPSAWVARFVPLMPAGETLDLACGGGRHARLLAAAGHAVVALDRDISAVAALRIDGVVPMQYDLEREGLTWPFEPGRFAGIVVTNYLHRPLFPRIIDSLAPGGVLIYETFALGNEQFGKPSNPAYLLAPGELLDRLRPALSVVAFEDGYVEVPRPAMVQRICAIKPDVVPGGPHPRLA